MGWCGSQPWRWLPMILLPDCHTLSSPFLLTDSWFQRLDSNKCNIAKRWCANSEMSLPKTNSHLPAHSFGSFSHTHCFSLTGSERNQSNLWGATESPLWYMARNVGSLWPTTSEELNSIGVDDLREEGIISCHNQPLRELSSSNPLPHTPPVPPPHA